MTLAGVAPSKKMLLFSDLQNELMLTRRMLERVPDGYFDCKPHEKSSSLGQLATHVASIPRWGVYLLTTHMLDLKGPNPPGRPQMRTNRAELIEYYDENKRALQDAVTSCSDETMYGMWTLKDGDRIRITDERFHLLRSFVINHMIHHRAHLGLYLRLLDVPVPSMYGPTADEGSW